MRLDKEPLKLALIGHYCSTGGISIHLQRLYKGINKKIVVFLIDESRLNEADPNIFNLRRDKKIIYLKTIWKSDVVHIHTSVPILRFLHVLIGKILFKKVLVTVHSLSTVPSSFKQLRLKILLSFCDKVILVSKDIQETLKVNNAYILNAFLPPDMDKESDLPESINLLLKKNHDKKLIISNAYRLNVFNNEDLYGLDLIIKLAAFYKDRKIQNFIIFVLASLDVNKDLYHKYIEIINNEGLDDYIYIHTEPLSFVKLIQKADLVIRATNTDGDALTIREALFMNTPVLASDVVQRPKGTNLFKSRNHEDLISVSENILNNSKNLVSSTEEKHLNKYFKIYNSI